MKFTDLPLDLVLIQACHRMGYTEPTPIQCQAIPLVLEGRDLFGLAQTGTGKTAAFALPILQQLMKHKERSVQPRVLVLTPTRELAIQIEENFKSYGKALPIRTRVIFGGVNQYHQVESMKKGVEILIATPGRLIDLYQQKLINLNHVETFVLDEADRMLDMGFVQDVRRIHALLINKKQTLLFSATMPQEIAKLSQFMLTNPARVEVTPVSTPVERIDQCVYFVDKNQKNNMLLKVLHDHTVTSALVFTRTKYEADKVTRFLNAGQIPALAIHGNKSQNARQMALSALKNRQIKALVATDVAARGIDVEELSHVINYNIPNISETYVHRIGRTARAQSDGTAISFCQSDERPFLKDIEKLIQRKIPIKETPEEILLMPAKKSEPKERTGPRTPSKKKESTKNFSNEKTERKDRSVKQSAIKAGQERKTDSVKPTQEKKGFFTKPGQEKKIDRSKPVQEGKTDSARLALEKKFGFKKPAHDKKTGYSKSAQDRRPSSTKPYKRTIKKQDSR